VTPRPLLLLIVLTVLGAETSGSAQAPALQLDGADIGLSKAIPKVGDEVIFLVPVKNATDRAAAVSCQVLGRATDQSGRAVRLAPAKLQTELQPGEARDVRLVWRPADTGFYDLSFELSDATGGGSIPSHRAELPRVAVVSHDLYFAWFGAPKAFRWCNVPTTVKEEDVGFWLRRGAIPCAWRGGVCYREWSKEQFVENWSSSRWIAIDEIGGPSEDTTKFMSALREIRAAHPDHFAAVWFMGAHDYWAEVKGIIDLFLPEVYLNYRGNHLGSFGGYLDAIRRTDAMSQTVFGLGINVIKDEKTGEPRVVPTREDVLRQVRHVKRIAPDMPGLGFFTSDSAAPGVAEYADELCGEYFVKPVVTLVDGKLSVEAGRRWQAHVTVLNCGGMAAREVRLRVGLVVNDKLTAVQEKTIAALPAGERQEVAVSLTPTRGVATLRAELLPSPQFTVLDPVAEELACSRELLPAELRKALAIVYLPAYPETESRVVPVTWQLPCAVAAVRVVEVDPSGDSKADAPCLTLSGKDQQTVRWVAAGTAPGTQRRLYAILPSGGQVAPPSNLIRYERRGDRIRVYTPSYQAELNAATDEITSLKRPGTDTELFRSPWSFVCSTQPKPQACEVTQSGDWLVVRLSVDCDAADGETRYVFSGLTPAVEISRRFRPKSPLKITGAAERCGLEQRGGTFALQPGVGGVASRGALHDSADYRDLYFGYLGDAPSEGNAAKAGWLDFSWDQRWDAGLGVAIAERWRDARSKEYDVTRFYDASDWIEVLHVWGVETTIDREQTSRVFLIPHGFIDMSKVPVPPAEAVWEAVHQPPRPVVGA